jgi:predicted porin
METTKMKKSILALAVLAGFATGAAHAQTSNVSIYGIADVGFVRDSGALAAGSTSSITSGGQSASRIGFKGREDLGNGMAAIFLLESGVLMDTGASDQGGLLFGRQIYVGLQSKLGTVRLGRMYNPLYEARHTYDPFDGGFGGDYGRIFINGGKRDNNAIVYDAPDNLGGVAVQALYALGEQPGDAAKARQMGLSIGYKKGPVDFKLVWDATNNNPASPAPLVTTRSTAAGGTYNFGPVMLTALAQVNSSSAAVALDTRDYLLGVTVPFDASKVIATYILHDNRAAADSDTRQWALGYTYALSKRSNLYTSYARLTNDRLAKLQTAALGGTDRIFSAGIRHLF